MKNAEAYLVPDSVNDALGGVASIVSDVIVSKELNLLASTVSDAKYGIYNGLIITKSGEIWKLVYIRLGGYMEQADVGIVAVSIISVGVCALISVANK